MSEWPSMTTMSSHFIEEDVHEPNVSKWRIRWSETIPYILLHVACIGVFWVGFSWAALALCLAMYVVRMFAITGFYHRYFSHRTFRTTRPVQFLMGLLGTSAVQRGPIWWAAHHRDHHKYSDTEFDPHSPKQVGFWKAHCGWFLCKEAAPVRIRLVRDWMRFPELVWLDRFHHVPVILTALLMLGLGFTASTWWPGLGLTAGQALFWGFFLSTVLCYHGTYTINSLAHVWGRRDFETPDDSRNNFWLALITLGEGWHNNHHHYPASVRQGFRWWELDPTWWTLWTMGKLRLVRDLNGVPDRVQKQRMQPGS